jgi:hypothetical protein
MRVVLGALDPMPALRQAKADAVNRSFNMMASDNLHRDQAHAHKRAEAAAVTAGAGPSVEFQAEAELRGIAAVELAALIAAKPNTAAQRELRRQMIMAVIAAAKTPAELDSLTVPPEVMP